MFYKILTAITFSFFIVGCGGSSGTTNTAQSTSTEEQIPQEDLNSSDTDIQYYSFRSDIMPILIQKCQACHGDSGNYSVTTPEETYRLLIQDAPRVSTGYAHFIVANDIEHSLLYKKALNIELHGGGEQLPYDSPEARILKEWILQGAVLDDINTTFKRNYTLLAWNDLGMHCMDGKDFSVFSILPPFNNLNAQLVRREEGVNKIVKSNVFLTYTATASLDGEFNTNSMLDENNDPKTNFWDYVQVLFGIVLEGNRGLTGNYTPSHNSREMLYNVQYDWWEATGLPLMPYDDNGAKNYYPMVQITAKDTNGTVLAETKVVLPVSDEMDCRICHGSNSGYTATRPSTGWENNSTTNTDTENDYKWNILRLHDDKFPNAVVDHQTALGNAGYTGYDNAGLYQSAKNGNAILCATCHSSNALPSSGIAGINSLTEVMHSKHATVIDPTNGHTLNSSINRSACYRCHPGGNNPVSERCYGKTVKHPVSKLSR